MIDFRFARLELSWLVWSRCEGIRPEALKGVCFVDAADH